MDCLSQGMVMSFGYELAMHQKLIWLGVLNVKVPGYQ